MNKRTLATIEVLIIVLMACVPLFLTFPYRVNIFLSWEGAYRMSQGQIPFRDFGIPLGGMYWVIPAVFFKIFGSQLITLIKAQVFINIIGGLAFRSILKSLSVIPAISFMAVLLFCVSYSFFNFWPWYNHTVIIYELIGIAFLFNYIQPGEKKRTVIWLILSAAFVCFSVFTKQDGGGMAFLICCSLLAYYSLINKRWAPFFQYLGIFIVLLFLIIYPLSQYSFSYWFNHGQAPHTSRVSLSEIITEFLSASQWIKFYIFLIVILLIACFKKWKELWQNQSVMYFLILVMAILGEAAIFQVTSYTPPDNNIFFHSFAIAFVLTLLTRLSLIDFNKPLIMIACVGAMMLWWSGIYEKYIHRILIRLSPEVASVQKVAGDGSAENIVNKNTYMISKEDPELPMEQWRFVNLNSFRKIYMPGPTVDGINRLMNMEIIRKGEDLKILNMSELTPLAAEIPFNLEKNAALPLWHHLGVGMFNRQAEIYEKRIAAHYYDLILFEYIPGLNNFYPFRTRDSLKIHYKMVDSFMAPRRGSAKSDIEIYIKP